MKKSRHTDEQIVKILREGSYERLTNERSLKPLGSTQSLNKQSTGGDAYTMACRWMTSRSLKGFKMRTQG